MSLPVHIRPEASQDISEAFNWYERQLPGLGESFLGNLNAVFERISRDPELHAIVYRDVRQTMVRKFPYVVSYLAASRRVEIVAVLHGSRDPATWRLRT